MRKKNYKGRCKKRKLTKCQEVVRAYRGYIYDISKLRAERPSKYPPFVRE